MRLVTACLVLNRSPAPLGSFSASRITNISRQGLEFLKEMQDEGGEENRVVLFLAAEPLTFSLGRNQVCFSRSTFFHQACSNPPIRHSVPRLTQSAS